MDEQPTYDPNTVPGDFPLHSIVQGMIDINNEATKTSNAKGFVWSDETVLSALMLVVTEVSEAAAVWRNAPAGQPMGDEFYDELADVILRLGSLVGFLPGGTWRLAHAVARKAMYNRTRPVRHGGKRL